ncbi:MAG: arylamine N-acetyltransferase [Candidatus Cloacimonetes bacterium]|nr:arylamine N-acetyltransferase [Candidatus Cloacimonadota bacterium]
MELAVFEPSLYRSTVKSFLQRHQIADVKADYKGLGAVLEAFKEIPYENVSKLLRQKNWTGGDELLLRLPDVLWNDFQENKLGGTCYSLTFFLEVILSNLGFECYPVSADMKWGRNVHCGLAVILEGVHWWCDPGYLLMTPMVLSGKFQQVYRTESSGIQLVFDGLKYRLGTFHGREIKWRYSFIDSKCKRSNFLHYWLASFEQRGMNGVCLTRQQKEGMIYIHNRFFKEVSRSAVRKSRLDSNWLKEIERLFGIPGILLEEAYSITKSRGKQCSR